jgi:hypothetical protein
MAAVPIEQKASELSESEWEYEYDAKETEDFYVTVELTPDKTKQVAAHHNDIFANRERLRAFKRRLHGHAHGRPRRKRRQRNLETWELVRDEDSSDDEDSQSRSDYDQDDVHEADDEDSDIERPALDIDLDQMEEPDMSLQTVDLHTHNPLISCRGGIFSCEWASSIGTEMFFVKRDARKELDREPLRKLNGWDLISISSTRLIASDATVPHPPEENNQTAAVAQALRPDSPPRRPFLKQLVDIKVKKNEMEAGTAIFPDEPDQQPEWQIPSLSAPSIIPSGVALYSTAITPQPPPVEAPKIPPIGKKGRISKKAQSALAHHAERVGVADWLADLPALAPAPAENEGGRDDEDY